jgi:AraC family transcriptional activator of pobA
MSELLGFSDPTNFTRLFRRRVGISPKAFRDSLKAEQ